MFGDGSDTNAEGVSEEVGGPPKCKKFCQVKAECDCEEYCMEYQSASAIDKKCAQVIAFLPARTLQAVDDTRNVPTNQFGIIMPNITFIPGQIKMSTFL